jgi:hypothetical protein
VQDRLDHRTALLLLRRGNKGALASSGSGPLHHSRRRTILLEFLCHEAHVRIDVMKEVLIAGAEIIQSVLARRGFRKAVLGTLAVTGETHIFSPTTINTARIGWSRFFVNAQNWERG